MSVEFGQVYNVALKQGDEIISAEVLAVLRKGELILVACSPECPNANVVKLANGNAVGFLVVKPSALSARPRAGTELIHASPLPALEGILPVTVGLRVAESSAEAEPEVPGAEMMAMMKQLTEAVSALQTRMEKLGRVLETRLSALEGGSAMSEAAGARLPRTQSPNRKVGTAAAWSAALTGRFSDPARFGDPWEKRTRKRGPGLDEEEEDDEDAEEDLMPRKGQTRGGGMSSGTEAPSDVSARMNPQMLKRVRKMGEGLGGRSSTDSEDGNWNIGDTDFAWMTKMRKKVRAKPEIFVMEFAAKTKIWHGIKDNRQVGRFAANGKRLRPVFGRMAGLHRTLMLFLEVCHPHHDKQPEQASASAMQACKALHQVEAGEEEETPAAVPKKRGT